jgi:hypothetical protein
MASINEKRQFVSSMYPGKGWKNKVKNMSDIQVTAIYLKEKAKGEPQKPKEINNHDDIPF